MPVFYDGQDSKVNNRTILQSGISDRMKSVEEKVQALTAFLEGE